MLARIHRSPQLHRRFCWLIAGPCLAFCLWDLAYLILRDFTLLKLESRAPHLQRSAILLQEELPFSFAGKSVWLFAREGERSVPIRISSYGTDGDEKLERVVWSRDGTLLAAIARLGAPGGKNLRRDYGEFYVASYNFTTRQRIAYRQPRRAQSQQIAQLLQQRGGLGPTAFPSPYDGSGSPLSLFEKPVYGDLYAPVQPRED